MYKHTRKENTFETYKNCFLENGLCLMATEVLVCKENYSYKKKDQPDGRETPLAANNWIKAINWIKDKNTYVAEDLRIHDMKMIINDTYLE